MRITTDQQIYELARAYAEEIIVALALPPSMIALAQKRVIESYTLVARHLLRDRYIIRKADVRAVYEDQVVSGRWCEMDGPPSSPRSYTLPLLESIFGKELFNEPFNDKTNETI